MNIVWHLTPGQEKEVQNALKNEGAPIRVGLGFEPITTIATIIAVTALVKAIINLYRDGKYKGVMINATVDPVEIREMPGWPARQVLVITAEGAKFYEPGTGESPAGELGKIVELLSKR